MQTRYARVMHLLLPLLASVVFVCGMLVVKKLTSAGVSSHTILFVANLCSGLLFSSLWVLGGTFQGWTMLWQPASIAALFMMGLTFTFLAIQRGDVSVATPIFGVKVLIVALMLTWVSGENLPMRVWYGAVLATFGIGLIQWTGRSHPQHIVLTIFLAVSAATCYATFDVLTQRWAPSWGAGRFLPLVFWFVGGLSLGLAPWVQWSRIRERRILKLLIPVGILIAIQAICITGAVAIFGDAARVNVVYALRGLWGVALAWAAARIWGGAEAELGRGDMLTRLTGALLLTTAVILVILVRTPLN